MKDDHTQGASGVNLVMTCFGYICLECWNINVSMAGAKSHESI